MTTCDIPVQTSPADLAAAPELPAEVSRWLDPAPVPGDETAALTWPTQDGVWTYRALWVEEWPVAENVPTRTRVTHVPSRLHVDYDVQPSRILFDHVAPGRTAAAIAGQAVDLLHAHSSTAAERAAALTAVVTLDAVGAYCYCGGLLHYGREGWRHINACPDCLTDPTECTDPADRAKRHRGCAQPAPDQCEHPCRTDNTYEATRACGADKRCCGGHDCDTAVPAEERADRVDPLDGQTFQVIPTPRVTELHFERVGVLTDSQWAIVTGQDAK